MFGNLEKKGYAKILVHVWNIWLRSIAQGLDRG